MSDDQFTKLFKYMQRIEDKLDGAIENMATKDSIQQILNRLDSIEKQLGVSEAERIVMGSWTA